MFNHLVFITSMCIELSVIEKYGILYERQITITTILKTQRINNTTYKNNKKWK